MSVRTRDRNCRSPQDQTLQRDAGESLPCDPVHWGPVLFAREAALRRFGLLALPSARESVAISEAIAAQGSCKGHKRRYKDERVRNRLTVQPTFRVSYNASAQDNSHERSITTMPTAVIIIATVFSSKPVSFSVHHQGRTLRGIMQ